MHDILLTIRYRLVYIVTIQYTRTLIAVIFRTLYISQYHIVHIVANTVFMQDNASIHTAKKVKDWFTDNKVRTIDWPLYSLDLNLIEHAW
jgi:transposase